MTTKPTRLIVTAGADPKAARAARFGLVNPSPTGKTAAATPSNPADAEKFAARAARFADVLGASGGSPLATSGTKVVTNKADADRMAARAARFADVSSNKGMATSTAASAAASPEMKAQMAARAAKFADVLMDQ